jgi:hypothetical protein
MNETNWERLYRIVEERRSRLGYSRTKLHAAGGPSSETLRALSLREGPPSIRQQKSLADLDGPLGWPVGTAWGLVADDRSDWTDDCLTDEQHALIDGPSLSPDENDLSNFATTILLKLRAMSPEALAEAKRHIARIVGIE